MSKEEDTAWDWKTDVNEKSNKIKIISTDVTERNWKIKQKKNLKHIYSQIVFYAFAFCLPCYGSFSLVFFYWYMHRNCFFYPSIAFGLLLHSHHALYCLVAISRSAIGLTAFPIEERQPLCELLPPFNNTNQPVVEIEEKKKRDK